MGHYQELSPTKVTRLTTTIDPSAKTPWTTLQYETDKTQTVDRRWPHIRRRQPRSRPQPNSVTIEEIEDDSDPDSLYAMPTTSTIGKSSTKASSRTTLDQDDTRASVRANLTEVFTMPGALPVDDDDTTSNKHERNVNRNPSPERVELGATSGPFDMPSRTTTHEPFRDFSDFVPSENLANAAQYDAEVGYPMEDDPSEDSEPRYGDRNRLRRRSTRSTLDRSSPSRQSSTRTTKSGITSRLPARLKSILKRHKPTANVVDDDYAEEIGMRPAFHTRSEAESHSLTSPSTTWYATDGNGNVLFDERGIPLPVGRDYEPSQRSVATPLESPEDRVVSPLPLGTPHRPVSQRRYSDVSDLQELRAQRAVSPTQEDSDRPSIWSQDGYPENYSAVGLIKRYEDGHAGWRTFNRLMSTLGGRKSRRRQKYSRWIDPLTTESSETETETEPERSESVVGSPARNASRKRFNLLPRKTLCSSLGQQLHAVTGASEDIDEVLWALRTEDSELAKVGQAFDHVLNLSFNSDKFAGHFWDTKKRRNRKDLELVGGWLEEQQTALKTYETLHNVGHGETSMYSHRIPGFEFAGSGSSIRRSAFQSKSMYR